MHRWAQKIEKQKWTTLNTIAKRLVHRVTAPTVGRLKGNRVIHRGGVDRRRLLMIEYAQVFPGDLPTTDKSIYKARDWKASLWLQGQVTGSKNYLPIHRKLGKLPPICIQHLLIGRLVQTHTLSPALAVKKLKINFKANVPINSQTLQLMDVSLAFSAKYLTHFPITLSLEMELINYISRIRQSITHCMFLFHTGEIPDL